MTMPDFIDEASRCFVMLCNEGFEGPEQNDYSIYFSNGTLGIEIGYDEREGSVITILVASVGGRAVRAGLSCLYVAADLGPAQDIRMTCRSRKVLKPVLDSHSHALLALLRVLENPGSDALLLKCHGSWK